jgi:hypothetical protein
MALARRRGRVPPRADRAGRRIAQSAAPGQVIFPSPANGATVASPVEIVYAHNPACEDDHPAYDTPYGQNMLPPQVVNVATGKNEMELSPGIGRRIVASPSLVGLDSVYVTAFEYGASSAIPRQGVQRTERIVMGLPNGTYEVKFTLFVSCAGSSAVLRFTVGAAAAPAAPRSLPRTLLEALSVLNDPNASPEARAAAERIVDAASGRTEDFTAEAVISVWPTGRLSAAALEALPWFKRFSEAFGAQLGVLLRKHLPRSKAGARPRWHGSGWSSRGSSRGPSRACPRRRARRPSRLIRGGVGGLPPKVQNDLIAQRAKIILKPGGKYVGQYENGVLTVDDPGELMALYKQLKSAAHVRETARPISSSRSCWAAGTSVSRTSRGSQGPAARSRWARASTSRSPACR